MTFKSIKILVLSFSCLLAVSFQCKKKYTNNEFISISGTLVDQNDQTLPNFEMYLTFDELSTQSFERKENEKIFKTNSNGQFQILIPRPNATKFHYPMLKFVDTSWHYEIQFTPDSSIFNALIPIYNVISSDNQINFGVVTLSN